MLVDVGRRLGADFLAGEVGVALAEAVGEAARLNEVLELGIQTPDGESGLRELPWETLVLPSPDGTVAAAGATALALHRNVALYRAVGGLGAVAAYKVRGPLRILVAIASPESQNEAGELLNYEAELARIVAAVDPARRGADAHVRVLAEGSVAAIRAALTEEAEGFHVLHLSCHARPGELILETADGEPDPVSAQRLLADALPAGVDLPMVVLSGCSTGLGTRAERVDGNDGTYHEGERALGGVARQLLQAGVPVVLAMQSPVTDGYAAELTAAVYGYLASAPVPDALVALSEARRRVEQARQGLPADAPRRGRAEWATPALWVRGLRLPLFNRQEKFGEVAQVSAPALAEGIVVRKVGEFVGRRQELRVARRALAGAKAG
ncbi:MAG: CHAT domain-containing protein, partial [Solirubrobacteraceae bacterium]